MICPVATGSKLGTIGVRASKAVEVSCQESPVASETRIVEASVDPKQTKIALTGIDRQQVGQVAAEMRSLRPPDPYKNKGVRYVGERLKKKVGKTGAK